MVMYFASTRDYRILMMISLVKCVLIFTSLGKISLYAGIKSTSSNVRPSPNNLEELLPLVALLRFVAMCKDSRRAKFHPKLFLLTSCVIIASS